MFKIKIKKPAFTLIELLVVIAIIGILTSLAVVSLQNSRRSARDAKRVSDVKQLQLALELYYQDNSIYPDSLIPGEELSKDSVVYMETIPLPPETLDGACQNENNIYTYSQQDNGASYTINFCLGSQTGELNAGEKTATPAGITSMTTNKACSASTVCGDVCSYEGTNYPTVQIGNQCWFAKNLNVGTRIDPCLTGQLTELSWKDGPSNMGVNYSCCIPEDVVREGSENNYHEYCDREYEVRGQSNNNIIEKYCYVNSDSNCLIYGGLYQWNEAMQYTTSESNQGICPTGWHIPTDAEWTTLITYLGGVNVAGGKMKETGTSHWSSPNTGADNSSGFTALPAGHIEIYAKNCYQIGCNHINKGTYFLSSSVNGPGDSAWAMSLGYSSAKANRSSVPLVFGFSVRCLKD